MAAEPASIQRDPKTAKAVAEYAEALGLSVSEFLEQHFANGNGADVIVDVDRGLDDLAEGSDASLVLPLDFSTRDMYADHD